MKKLNAFYSQNKTKKLNAFNQLALNLLLLREFHEPRTFGNLKGPQSNHILCDYLSNKNKVVCIEYDIFGILFHKRYSRAYEKEHLQMQ
jgi:hypothetical protein